MSRLRWLRLVGDTLFGVGAFAFVAFVIRLAIKPRAATALARQRQA